MSDEAATGHLPGEQGVWIFIIGDMLMFGLLFLTFAVYRGDDLALYRVSSAELNQGIGLINTLLLLTSSWFVAMAVHAFRADRRSRAGLLLSLAMLCGLGFIAMKVVEYAQKIGAGITIATNDFFMFYFMFTGIHLIHVLIGMVVLICLLVVTRKPEAGQGDLLALEGGGAFWHLVDLLWIVLFALFYLVR